MASLRKVRGRLMVWADDWVESLHGLEALEHAGGLALHRLMVLDLRELRSLRTIRALHPKDAAWCRRYSAGGLRRADHPERPRAAGGLGQPSHWARTGAPEPHRARATSGGASVDIYMAPKLRDVSALGAADSMEELHLHSTAVRDFDGIDLHV